MRACGLFETQENFFIDHLAPLCSILGIPLITSKVQTKFQFERYYPNLKIILKNWNFSYLAENYTKVIYSFTPSPLFSDIIQKEMQGDPSSALFKQKLQFIYHFHGCSDKGFHSKWVDPNGHIKEVDLLYIYGERMKDLLQDKKLLQLPKRYESIGNYRKTFYLKYQSFFDKTVEWEVFSKFKNNNPNILYAPTWDDAESSSSLLHIHETIFKNLPDHFNLIIKLHPRATRRIEGNDPRPVFRLIEKYKMKKNILFLPFYPLVYPILNKIDLYIGDYSSVGYDALSFDIPMLFLNPNNRSINDKGALLHQCGDQINKEEYHLIFEKAKKALKDDSYFQKRKDIYKYAFGKDRNYEDLKELLKTTLEKMDYEPKV